MEPVCALPEQPRRRGRRPKKLDEGLTVEEIERRKAEAAEARTAKKCEECRAKIAMLVQAGVYVPLRPGRKRMYPPDEAAQVAKRQRHESYLRRRERINAAMALLAQTANAEATAVA